MISGIEAGITPIHSDNLTIVILLGIGDLTEMGITHLPVEIDFTHTVNS
jgi:hypothetical protein